MAQRRPRTGKKQKKERQPKEASPTAQYAFDFLEPTKTCSHVEPSPMILEGEITLPDEQLAEAIVPHVEKLAITSDATLSEGALEHGFFLQQSAKYEDRLFKTVVALVAVEVLAIFVKGGIAISPKLLEQWGVATDNLRLICGIFGGASLILAGTVLYFVLRANEYVPQKQMHFPPRRPVVTILANGLLTLGCLVLAAGFFIVVWQTFWDMAYLFRWIADHLTYVLDGWAPR